ncbi:MAG: DUF4830 domain-containing protein [Oscillospiraceae bacterium]|nr:DUF4830 domain-containing protein [Oscillospiraceae bacterium]
MYKSTRINRKRLIILAVIMMITMLFAVRCAALHGASVRVQGVPDIIAYLNTFGWAVEPEPVTIKNLQIPAKFTETYQNYNSLQKQQGFDLSRYRADIVESYTFRILNHPASGDVFANVLVFRGRIIGGDICSFSINGFMTSFDSLQLTVDS